ncbi:MAG: hypothetical protein AABY45_01965, partial [Deltaproteobacteria bacterium]
MTINGNYFQSGATLTFKDPIGVAYPSTATKLTFVSSSQLNYQINNNSAAGTWTVTVTNPDSQTSNTVSFTVSPITTGSAPTATTGLATSVTSN